MAWGTTTNPRRSAAALATAATILIASAANVAAAPLPRLAVDRTPDAADCPDAPALAAAVEQHMQRPALDPEGTDAAAPLYEIRILRSEDGYSATLQAGDLTRHFTDAGTRCDELAAAVALTLAILLDSGPAARPAPFPARREPAQHAPAAPAPPPRPLLRGIAVDLGAAITWGYLMPPSGAVTGELSLRFSFASLGVGAVVVPPRTVEVAPGTVELWLAAVPIRLCGDLAGNPDGAHLSLCGQGLIGMIHGTGSGYTPNREGSAPWLALGTTMLLEGPIIGPVGWSARATCTVPFVASAFTVDAPSGPGSATTRVTAFSPWPGNLLLGAGLRVAIR